jgi:hypothetical protein
MLAAAGKIPSSWLVSVGVPPVTAAFRANLRPDSRISAPMTPLDGRNHEARTDSSA